jgi:cytoskeleton protein RodZ
MTSDPDLSPDEHNAGVSAPSSNPPAVAPSPGTQLRRAREDAHLTLEDFAAQTKLAVGTLEALEADDFASLLEPVYVRGYYRKCARLLGLSEEALIAAYNARVKQTQPQTPARIRLSAGAAESRSGFGRVLGALIMAIIVALLAYLWFTRAEDSTVSEAAVQIVPDVAITTTPAISAMAEAEQPAPTESPVATAAPTATSEPAAAAVSGEPTLNLQFRETSWVRINDAEGRALMNGLMDGGTSQTVSGTPPLTLFFGNAPGVALTFNGQRVDLSPYTQSNSTARLTLPLTN